MHKSKRPYMLPKRLVCDAAVAESGMTIKLVEDYIHKHNAFLVRYNYLESLYKGFHDVFNEPEKEDWKPDNRLAVNFPRYMTETFSGYGYGIPIRVTHPDENINDAIQEFGRINEITDHEAEMVKLCCIYGHAWEYLYQDEETNTKITAFSPKEVFVVYDDTLKNKALFAVRYGYHEVEGEDWEPYGEVMTREEIISFDHGKFTDHIPNPYGYIPVVQWKLNEECIGLYEEVAGLIETYNHTIGEKANDVDAFAEAYLAIMGAKVDEEDVVRIRDDRIINMYGTDDAKDILVQFLTKPTADGTQENLLDRLENLIYQTSMVANISDETFGNATSGTALAYKLQAMSNLALTFDRKIEKALRKRYKIFSSLTTNVPNAEMWRDIEVQMTRNIPKNIKEETEIASQLEGVVSKETQLSVLSIVPDPDEEIKKMDKESEKDQVSIVDNRMFMQQDLDEGAGDNKDLM